MIHPKRDAELLPYVLLVRVVRMADHRALQNKVGCHT